LLTNVFNPKTSRRSLMPMLRRSLILVLVFVVTLAPTLAVQPDTAHVLVPSHPTHGTEHTAAMDSINVTQLMESIANSVSHVRIENLTRDLSTGYPARTWDIDTDTPSDSLVQAWNWANESLMALTGGELWFRNATKYHALYAIKQGIGAVPRQAIIITGVIDSLQIAGANDVAVSVAAVLETARVLQNLSLYCDVYYVLTSAGRVDPDHDLGASSFVDWLTENDIEIITAIAYDRLLFHRSQYPFGLNIALRSLLDSSLYQRDSWISDLMILFSRDYGNGLLRTLVDKGSSTRSFAYEMWLRGIPAVYVSQGYYHDSASGTSDDTYDYYYYSYEKAAEAVASVSAMAYLVGLFGAGKALLYSSQGTVTPTTEVSCDIVTNIRQYVNASITWLNQSTIRANIIRETTGETVYQRVESDGHITLKYLATEPGMYRVVVELAEGNNTTVSLQVVHSNDCDGDSLSDEYEVSHGLNPYLLDSDRDGLSDDFEISIGSDPREGDSDNDGALDYDEYIWGSDLLLNDTDHDNITDGEEAALGISPVDPDTDGDGINDYDEVYVYHTDPLNVDTDGDGLQDAYEITMGLNPLSRDTDGDSLSDMFEVLNHIDPTLRDTDGDGWTDAYEVYHCMSPTSPDTDGDLLPDAWDWNPTDHWVTAVAPVSVLAAILLLAVFAFLKHRKYIKTGGS